MFNQIKRNQEKPWCSARFYDLTVDGALITQSGIFGLGQNVYINTETGSDANNGLTSLTAVFSLEQAINIMGRYGSGGDATFFIEGIDDILIDTLDFSVLAGKYQRIDIMQAKVDVEEFTLAVPPTIVGPKLLWVELPTVGLPAGYSNAFAQNMTNGTTNAISGENTGVTISCCGDLGGIVSGDTFQVYKTGSSIVNIEEEVILYSAIPISFTNCDINFSATGSILSESKITFNSCKMNSLNPSGAIDAQCIFNTCYMNGPESFNITNYNELVLNSVKIDDLTNFHVNKYCRMTDVYLYATLTTIDECMANLTRCYMQNGTSGASSRNSNVLSINKVSDINIINCLIDQHRNLVAMNLTGESSCKVDGLDINYYGAALGSNSGTGCLYIDSSNCRMKGNCLFEALSVTVVGNAPLNLVEVINNSNLSLNNVAGQTISIICTSGAGDIAKTLVAARYNSTINIGEPSGGIVNIQSNAYDVAVYLFQNCTLSCAKLNTTQFVYETTTGAGGIGIDILWSSHLIMDKKINKSAGNKSIRVGSALTFTDMEVQNDIGIGVNGGAGNYQQCTSTFNSA